MRRRRIEAGIWTLALAAVVLGSFGWRGAVPTPVIERSTSAMPASSTDTVDAGQLIAAVDSVVSRDPFRITRRPAPVAFGTQVSPSAPVPPQPERPRLRLAGIIGGPPWEAILEGFPSRAGGIVVRGGDLVGDVRIRRITRDTVVVEASDSTWKLTLQRPR
jgi:hypothetical protein